MAYDTIPDECESYTSPGREEKAFLLGGKVVSLHLEGLYIRPRRKKTQLFKEYCFNLYSAMVGTPLDLQSALHLLLIHSF